MWKQGARSTASCQSCLCLLGACESRRSAAMACELRSSAAMVAEQAEMLVWREKEKVHCTARRVLFESVHRCVCMCIQTSLVGR